MKRPMPEVALTLKMHPTNLLLHLSERGFSFEDMWPEIEETWVEGVGAKDWSKFAASKQKKPTAVAQPAKSPQSLELGVSDEAGFLIEKMWRNERWGSAYVSVEAIQKHTHLDAEEMKKAIYELVKKELLLSQGPLGPYSLNPSRQSEIERVARIMVSKQASRF